MNFVYLAKVINMVSLILIPCSYIFSLLGFNNRGGFLYVWLCLCGFLINYLNRKKTKLLIIPSIAIFAPVAFSKSYIDVICIGFYGFIIVYLFLKGNNYIKYTSELDMFRKGVFIATGTFVLSFMGGLKLFTIYSGKYVLIYLVSSILLLRNLRFYEYNTEKLEGTRANRISSVILVIAAFVLSLEGVRRTIVDILKNSYLFIIDKVLYLTSWLIIWLGNIIGNIILSIINFLRKIMGYKEAELGKNNLIEIIKPKNDDYDALINKLIDNKYFSVAIKLLFIVLIALILIRLLKSLVSIQSNNEDYIEEKEYISKEENNERQHRSILEFLKPKTENERVRLIYQKYMHECSENDIYLKSSDTTEEINKKSSHVFNENLINKLRAIYIKVRYGEIPPDKKTVKEMEDCYREIKK